jgi:hypothetical protein
LRAADLRTLPLFCNASHYQIVADFGRAMTPLRITQAIWLLVSLGGVAHHCMASSGFASHTLRNGRMYVHPRDNMVSAASLYFRELNLNVLRVRETWRTFKSLKSFVFEIMRANSFQAGARVPRLISGPSPCIEICLFCILR